jgi:hypothetical protein
MSIKLLLILAPMVCAVLSTKGQNPIQQQNPGKKKKNPALKTAITELKNNKYNILAGKICKWNITPAKNANAPSLLTDNCVVVDNFPMSKQKDAVVIWKKIKRKSFPLILCFDLGKISPISEVMLNTSGGGIHGKSRWPKSIRLYLSNDGESYHFAGDLIRASLPSLPAPADKKEHSVKLFLRNIDSRSRFVKLAITPNEEEFRCDEIQVYNDKQILRSDKALKADKNYITENSIKMRFNWDMQKIRSAVKKAGISQSQKRELLDELDKLGQQAASWKFTGNWKTFRAILPFNKLHSKIWSIYGKLLAAEKFSPLTIWTSYRYKHLGFPVLPERNNKRLKIKMMHNEHRAVTFNLTNASVKEKTVKFKIDNLSPGKWLKVFQIENVDTYYFIPKRQALVELFAKDGFFHTTVSPGMTRQIWLSINSKHLKPQTYHTKIKIQTNDVESELPLQLTVSNIKMPEEPTLTLCVYDNSGRRFNKNLQSQVAQNLKSHLVTCKCDQALAPLLAIPDASYFDEDANLIKPLDFSVFDQHLETNPGFRKYLFTQSSHCKKTFPFSPESPKFSKAISQWAEAWENHLIEKEIPKGKIIFQYHDEPTAEKAKANIKWLKAVKAVSKRISSYTTYHLALPRNLMKEMVALNDITTPTMTLALWAGGNQKSERDMKLYDIFTGIPKSPNKLWLYMCIDPIDVDPEAYYRLQAWQCFKLGATGSAFWSYFDTRGHSSWNKYISEEKNYSFIYRDENSIIDSKNWKAIREGVEDYEYLNMLSEEIKKLKFQDKDVSRSQKVLDSAMQIALKGASHNWYWYNWSRNSFFKQIEQARLMVLDELERLQIH